MATAPVYGTVSEKSIADRFLADIGAPATPEMERAVIAWMRAESGPGSVTANNPWNLTGSLWSNIVGFWRGGSATEQHDFPVFHTVNDGVDAAAQNLKTNAYGYPAVIQQARAGNANGFLNALADSSWCTCHYQKGGGPNLLAIYNSIGSLGSVVTHAPGNFSSADATLTEATSATSDVAKWLIAAIGDSSGKTWDQWYSDTGLYMFDFSYSGPNKPPSGLVGEDIWNAVERLGLQNSKVSATDATRIAADALAHGATKNAIPGVDALGAIAGVVGQAGAALFDAKHWAHALAVIGGAGLILWGGKMVWEAST